MLLRHCLGIVPRLPSCYQDAIKTLSLAAVQTASLQDIIITAIKTAASHQDAISMASVILLSRPGVTETTGSCRILLA